MKNPVIVLMYAIGTLMLGYAVIAFATGVDNIDEWQVVLQAAYALIIAGGIGFGIWRANQ